MFKKLVVGALAAGLLLGGAGNAFAYVDANTIDCSKTVPDAFQMKIKSEGLIGSTVTKCGKTFYLKEKFPTGDSYGTWTAIYKR
ncbi:LCI fold-containing protein [Bacillus bombysepticus]|uniref:LCI fold-containing protein n=1 Tax=Bacillus bombysepticus TaxID=658666 RepID=UPI003017EFC4